MSRLTLSLLPVLASLILAQSRIKYAALCRFIQRYQLYPECSCYKAFPSEGESKTWSEAREQCIRDGGDLMVIETQREREDVYIPLYNSVSWYSNPWMGVYIPQGGNDWTTVKGQPVLSTWWAPGYPDKYGKYGKCAQADSTSLLININNCAATRPFICEISL